MISSYDFRINHPVIATQLPGKDLLVCYKSPLRATVFNPPANCNKILFVLQNSIQFRYGGQSYLLNNSNALFITNATPHPDSFYEEDGEVIWFCFPNNFLQQVYHLYREQLPWKAIASPPGKMVFEINVNDITEAFLYSIMPYFGMQPVVAECLLELKFRELIVNLLANPGNEELLAYVNCLGDRYKKPSLTEVMEENYTYNLPLAGYAKIAFRSLAAFKREFDHQYHTTPGKWLTKKRLQYAQLLLVSSVKNIHEIAYESGFENVTHFCRVFKEKFGSSPLQYRKHRMAIPATNE